MAHSKAHRGQREIWKIALHLVRKRAWWRWWEHGGHVLRLGWAWLYPRISMGKAAHFCQSFLLSLAKPEIQTFMQHVPIFKSWRLAQAYISRHICPIVSLVHDPSWHWNNKPARVFPAVLPGSQTLRINMLFYLKNWRLLETDGKSCQPLPAVLLNHLCPVQAEQSNCFHSTYTGLSSCWQPPRSPTCFRSVCSKDRRVQTFQVLLFLPSMEFRVSEKVTLETEAFELDVALLTVTFSRFPNQGSEEGFGSSAY